MKQFKVGDAAVHLSHGVGVIKSIEEREFSPGKKQRFYIMEIEDNGAPKKVFVPFENTSQRLRPIIKQGEVRAILKELSEGGGEADTRTWNMRYREYMELIHSGDTKAMARVLHTLYHLASDGTGISFGEKKLMESAKDRLTKELALACNITSEECEAMIDHALHGHV
jgi:CarD family transcriptional regulator